MSNAVELSRPREGVARITMNLAESGGFVSWKAVGALADALRDARAGGARVAVLAASLAGHWYQHAWLPDLLNAVTGKPTSGPGEAWFRALDEIASPQLVTIAAISGDCSGGGAELGWACDLRIAEEQATFSQPEVMLGLTTGIGGTSRLVRLIGRTVAAEMVLDGAPLSARRIYELGGVNRVVPAGEALPVALAWASRLADRPAGALAALKKILLENDDSHLSAALAGEQTIFQQTAMSAAAQGAMRDTQTRFDAGDTPRKVYGSPRG